MVGPLWVRLCTARPKETGFVIALEWLVIANSFRYTPTYDICSLVSFLCVRVTKIKMGQRTYSLVLLSD